VHFEGFVLPGRGGVIPPIIDVETSASSGVIDRELSIVAIIVPGSSV
jgi:hypothetical protein